MTAKSKRDGGGLSAPSVSPRQAMASLPAGFETRDLSHDELVAGRDRLDLDALRIAATDGRAVVRRNTALALEVLGAESPSLHVLLRDSEPSVRRAAASAVTSLPLSSAPLVLEALKGLSHNVEPGRAMLLKRVTELLGQADDAVLAALNQSGRGVEVLIDGLSLAGEPALATLSSGLEHPSLLVRLNAVRGMERMVGRGVLFSSSLLETALHDPIDEVRKVASQVHRALVLASRVSSALPPLPEAVAAGVLEADVLAGFSDVTADRWTFGLQDGRVAVRINAARALAQGASCSTEARRRLTVLLKDSEPGVRHAAAQALAACVGDPGIVVPEVLRALIGAEPSLAQDLLGVIDAFGDAALPHLSSALDSPPESVKQSVGRVLSRWGARLVEPLLEVLADERWSQRARQHVVMLLERGGLAQSAVDTDAIDAEQVARAIEQYRKSIEPRRAPVPVLPAAFQRPSRAADATVWPIDGFDTKLLDVALLQAEQRHLAVDWLERALQDGRPMVRMNAANGLGVLGKAAERASYNLAVRVRDQDPGVSTAAARALQAIKPNDESIIVLLALALPAAHANAIDALRGALEALGTRIVPPLLRAMERNPPQLYPAVSMLACWFPAWFVKPLAELLTHRRLKVQEKAALALRDVGAKAAPVRDQLLAALSVQGGQVRLAAIEALSMAKPSKEVLTQFEALWHANPSRATRHMLRLGYERFGFEPPKELEP